MNKKLPLYQRLAYASTDTAGNLLYCIISGYLLYFYTDVFGLSVGVAGTILLCTRFLDAFDAPIWGFIIDHTKSKYGKNYDTEPDRLRKDCLGSHHLYPRRSAVLRHFNADYFYPAQLKQ